MMKEESKFESAIMGFRTIQGPKSIMIKMSKKSDFGI